MKPQYTEEVNLILIFYESTSEERFILREKQNEIGWIQEGVAIITSVNYVLVEPSLNGNHILKMNLFSKHLKWFPCYSTLDISTKSD